MWFIKTHETVNCNNTLRQLFIFLFLCSTSAMLRYIKLDTGGLAVAAAWLAFHHLFFFRIDGLWREFLLAVAQLLLSMQNQAPFFPALFLLCSALSRLSWLLQLFWDPWAAFLLGLLQVVLASLPIFSFASSLAWLNFFIERVAPWLWLSFWCQCRIIVY